MYSRLGENPGNISVYVWSHLLPVGPLHTTSSDPGTGSSRNPLPDNMAGPIAWDRKHVGLTRGLHGRHNNTNKTPFPPTFQKTLCTCKTIFPTQQYNNIQLFYTMHKAHTTVNPRDIIHILVTQPHPGQTTGNPGRGVVDFTGRRLTRGPPKLHREHDN